MERLKQLYFNFSNSKEYRELGEMPEVRQAIGAFYSFTEKQLSDKDFYNLENLFADSTLYNEMQGFIYGFRYAVGLMIESMPKGGVFND